MALAFSKCLSWTTKLVVVHACSCSSSSASASHLEHQISRIYIEAPGGLVLAPYISSSSREQVEKEVELFEDRHINSAHMKWFRKMNRLGRQKGDEGGPLMLGRKIGTYPAPLVKSIVPAMLSARVELDPQSASLEGLAVELQFEILERLTDLPSLHAIVHASPLYHRAYMTRRQSILAKVVSRDIGPDTVLEAQAICMALGADKKDGSEIRNYLKWYRNSLRNPASISIESFPLHHIAMLSQIQCAVRFAIKDFCQAALSRHPLSNEKEDNISPLSANETRRISRAFYRFELFCTIFNQAEIGVGPDLDCMDKCHLFLDNFPAWEREEIACIRDYIIDRYAQLLARYKNELLQQSPEGDPGDSSEEDRPFEGNVMAQSIIFV